jgi:hypothetical protein
LLVLHLRAQRSPGALPERAGSSTPSTRMQILSDARQAKLGGPGGWAGDGCRGRALVALHWGQEYRSEPHRTDQRRIARALALPP